MGRLVIREVSSQRDMQIVAAVDAPGTSLAGRDAGELAGVERLGVRVVGAERLSEALRDNKPDVLVDFTVAEAAVKNVRTAAEQGVAVVVGTTGFTPEQLDEMEGIVKRTGIAAIVAPNMSAGVNVFFKLVGEAARLLGGSYDVEIVEAHHAHKVDAPSGTALKVAEIIAREFGLGSESIRCGRPAGKRARERGEIYVHSIRAGDIVGEHTVTFATQGERLELVHRVHSREAFARGAVEAIRYVVAKGRPGVIQDMRDVLGLAS